MATMDELVTEAFSNAKENGYDLLATMTDAEIMDDMMTYDASLEHQDEDEVLDAIIRYRRKAQVVEPHRQGSVHYADPNFSKRN